MSRTKWMKNEIKKKVPTRNDVFRTLDGSVWIQKGSYFNRKIKIKHIVLDRFIIEDFEIRNNEEPLDPGLESYFSIAEIIKNYHILPEYESRLEDAVYAMTRGNMLPTKEQVENVVGIMGRVDNIVSDYEKTIQYQNDLEEDLEEESIEQGDLD